MHHIVTPGSYPAGVTALLAGWTEKLAGGLQVERSDSPPLARVMGVGRQQQQRLYVQVLDHGKSRNDLRTVHHID